MGGQYQLCQCSRPSTEAQSVQAHCTIPKGRGMSWGGVVVARLVWLRLRSTRQREVYAVWGECGLVQGGEWRGGYLKAPMKHLLRLASLRATTLGPASVQGPGRDQWHSTYRSCLLSPHKATTTTTASGAWLPA